MGNEFTMRNDETSITYPRSTNRSDSDSGMNMSISFRILCDHGEGQCAQMHLQLSRADKDVTTSVPNAVLNDNTLGGR